MTVGRVRRRLVMNFDETLASKPLVANRAGAYCMICNRPSDSEMIMEQHRGPRGNRAVVRVRCHGDEEIGIFEFGSEEWTIEDDLARAMKRRRWFDPMEKLGNIVNGGRIHG